MKRLLGCATIVIIVAVAFVATLLAYWVYGDRSLPTAATRVVIPNGATFDEVLETLRSSGVIAHTLPLHVLAKVRGEEAEVRAGEYVFAPHESETEVLRVLITQGAQVARWVTIPEGFTAAQIARRLQSAGIGNASTFERAFMTSSIVVDGARTKNLEGFLFPDSYLIPVGAAPQQVQRQLVQAFFAALPRDAASRSRALHVSVTQAVTIASLVEREAKINADRPLIAGVIYHRLRLGMPLEIDATIEYALPQHKTELSRSDLSIPSPYNTYLHTGLPPTPIANPGRASLEAAFHPAITNALYYVYCGHGHHVFADTLAEHQANVARCLR